MTVVALVDADNSKFSAETLAALRFLRDEDPSGCFACVARSILDAYDKGICLNADSIEFVVCTLARVFDVVRPQYNKRAAPVLIDAGRQLIGLCGKARRDEARREGLLQHVG